MHNYKTIGSQYGNDSSSNDMWEYQFARLVKKCEKCGKLHFKYIYTNKPSAKVTKSLIWEPTIEELECGVKKYGVIYIKENLVLSYGFLIVIMMSLIFCRC